MGDSAEENSYESQQGDSVFDTSNLRYKPMTGPTLGVSTGRVYTPSSSVNIFDFPGAAHEPSALEESTNHVDMAPVLKDHFPELHSIPQFFGQGASQLPETSEDSVGDNAIRIEEQEDIELPHLVPVRALAEVQHFPRFIKVCDWPKLWCILVAAPALAHLPRERFLAFNIFLVPMTVCLCKPQPLPGLPQCLITLARLAHCLGVAGALQVQDPQDMLMCQPPCTVRPASRWFPSLSWESECERYPEKAANVPKKNAQLKFRQDMTEKFYYGDPEPELIPKQAIRLRCNTSTTNVGTQTSIPKLPLPTPQKPSFRMVSGCDGYAIYEKLHHKPGVPGKLVPFVMLHSWVQTALPIIIPVGHTKPGWRPPPFPLEKARRASTRTIVALDDLISATSKNALQNRVPLARQRTDYYHPSTDPVGKVLKDRKARVHKKDQHESKGFKKAFPMLPSIQPSEVIGSGQSNSVKGSRYPTLPLPALSISEPGPLPKLHKTLPCLKWTRSTAASEDIVLPKMMITNAVPAHNSMFIP